MWHVPVPNRAEGFLGSVGLWRLLSHRLGKIHKLCNRNDCDVHPVIPFQVWVTLEAIWRLKNQGLKHFHFGRGTFKKKVDFKVVVFFVLFCCWDRRMLIIVQSNCASMIKCNSKVNVKGTPETLEPRGGGMWSAHVEADDPQNGRVLTNEEQTATCNWWRRWRKRKHYRGEKEPKEGGQSIPRTAKQ